MSTYANCPSCNSSGEFSDLKNTWTPKSSLQYGDWSPYYLSCGSPDCSTDKKQCNNQEKKIKENYGCTSCGKNNNSLARRSWTTSSNINMDNYSLSNKVVLSNTPIEHYPDTNCNSSQFLTINKTWNRQKLFTT
jgi:hypothetical protein